jgi:hypothetical protein
MRKVNRKNNGKSNGKSNGKANIKKEGRTTRAISHIRVNSCRVVAAKLDRGIIGKIRVDDVD